MKTVLALLALLLFATSAEARYYDSDRDGPCYSLKTAKQKAGEDYLKYRPREDGGRCWYRPGKPWTVVAKKKEVVPHADNRRQDKSQPVVVQAPNQKATAGYEEAGETFHRVSVSLLYNLSAEPASFNERFEVTPARWFDLIIPYASPRAHREQEQRLSSLAD